MFKITTQTDGDDSIALKLDGKLTSPWTDELDRHWRQLVGSERKAVRIDLTGVTFIGSEGKALLARMWNEGATFHVTGCLNTSIVEEILEHGRADASLRPNSLHHHAERK